MLDLCISLVNLYVDPGTCVFRLYICMLILQTCGKRTKKLSFI